MSSKNNVPRLRLRSQTNVNSRNKATTVISHYFKKSSSSENDDASKEHSAKTKSDSWVEANRPPESELRTKALTLLNLSDDMSDFSTPKPIKRVVPKIFEPKFKPNPEISKRSRKKVTTNKKITESSRKFLYESKDFNQEHLNLAIALSKSMQDEENASQPSCSANDELTSTQENTLKIKTLLSKFEFTNNGIPPKSEKIPPKPTKTKRGKNYPFMSTLIRRTVEDRNNIIQRKITEILVEKSRIDTKKHVYDSFSVQLRGSILEQYYCHEKVLFKKAQLIENEDFYTNQLVTPTSAKCGNLLRDWSKILGREITPPREVIQTDSKRDDEKTNSLNISENSNLDHISTIKLGVEVPIILNTKNEVSEIVNITLNQTSCRNSKSLGRDTPTLLIKDDVEVTNNRDTTDEKIDTIRSDLTSINTKFNTTIRSITPDLFSDSEDDIFITKSPKHDFSNETFIISSKVPENSNIPQNSSTVEVLDLTQSSNSDKFVDLSQLSDENFENRSDKSDESNDSLFDLPKFDIQYTTHRPEKEKLNYSFEKIVDLSQSSDSCDHAQTPIHLNKTVSPIQSSISNSNVTIFDKNEIISRENSIDNHNSFNESQIDSSPNCLNQPIVDQSLSRENSFIVSHISDEPLIQSPLCENLNTLVQNCTPTSRPDISKYKLKRKSKSFVNESPRNTSLKRFNSFIENFDYELETSAHISLNANKRNQSISPIKIQANVENFNSQTDTDDSMIVISDEELNYSCSTPYRKVKSDLCNISSRRVNKTLCGNKLTTTTSSLDSESSDSEYEVKNDRKESIHNETMISNALSCSNIVENPVLPSTSAQDNTDVVEIQLTQNHSNILPNSMDNLAKYSPSRANTMDFTQSYSNIINNQSELYDYYDMDIPNDYEHVYEKTVTKPELSTNISLLLGDSFDRELRRTTSLWDRIVGKKDTKNVTETTSEITQSVKVPKCKTPLPKRNALHFETPTTQIKIKTHDITPMPNYEVMNTPDISKELQKYGLKSLKRRRATQILKYIYEQTHPLDETNPETFTDSEENQSVRKRIKQKSPVKLSKNDNFIPIPPSNIEIVGDLLSQSCADNDLIFETKQSTKIASCRLPFHIAWYNFVSENSDIRLRILKYFPIQLEEICTHFKNMGFKYHVNDILSFLDKKCITIRTNQNNQGNSNNKKSTNKKRY